MEKNKKEMINEYKNRTMIGGVYKITNSKTDNYWIESCMDINAAINKFNFSKSINSCGGYNSEIEKEWNETGAEFFKFEILEKLEKKPEMDNKEFKKEIKLLEELWKTN